MRLIGLSSVVVLLLFNPLSTASACPNCKEAVAAQSSEADGTARGFNLSILFMLAVPSGVLGIGSLAVARAVKRGALPEW